MLEFLHQQHKDPCLAYNRPPTVQQVLDYLREYKKQSVPHYPPHHLQIRILLETFLVRVSSMQSADFKSVCFFFFYHKHKQLFENN